MRAHCEWNRVEWLYSVYYFLCAVCLLLNEISWVSLLNYDEILKWSSRWRCLFQWVSEGDCVCATTAMMMMRMMKAHKFTRMLVVHDDETSVYRPTKTTKCDAHKRGDLQTHSKRVFCCSVSLSLSRIVLFTFVMCTCSSHFLPFLVLLPIFFCCSAHTFYALQSH